MSGWAVRADSGSSSGGSGSWPAPVRGHGRAPKQDWIQAQQPALTGGHVPWSNAAIGSNAHESAALTNNPPSGLLRSTIAARNPGEDRIS